MSEIVRSLPAIGRPGFNPWVGKIPQRREWLPTPVFWPGEFHGVAKSQTRLSDKHAHMQIRKPKLRSTQHKVYLEEKEWRSEKKFADWLLPHVG